jgi:hypothetical protein
MRTRPVVDLTDEGERAKTDETEWEADRLLDLVSHDLVNQHQAAMGFLEILGTSGDLSADERVLVDRAIEALERTGRLVLQVRTAMVDHDTDRFVPARIQLDKALLKAAKAVEGAFSRGRLRIDTEGLDGATTVAADALLVEMLTQLMLLLSDRAPPGRECSMGVIVELAGSRVALRFSSQDFALNPMVIGALVADRRPLGDESEVGTAKLVRQLLHRYGGTARMEDAPAGEVGAHLVIELPGGEASDAVSDDSR